MKFLEKSEDSKDFIRLKSDETIVGLFRGDIYDFRQHWTNGKSEVCIGEGCQYCAEKKKPAFRFRINLILNEGGKYIPKIFEQGWTVYDALRELHKEYDLEHTLVKITRKGTSMNDTSYTIIPAKAQLTAEQKKAVEKVELLPLEHQSRTKSEKQEPAMAEAGEDDIGFG